MGQLFRNISKTRILIFWDPVLLRPKIDLYKGLQRKLSNLVFHFTSEDFLALSTITDLRSPLQVKFTEGETKV